MSGSWLSPRPVEPKMALILRDYDSGEAPAARGKFFPQLSMVGGF
jgi:hypothetical protein